MDYHLAEVQTVSTFPGRRTTYHAYCRCGWLGPKQERKGDAEDDAAAHDRTENPITEEEE